MWAERDCKKYRDGYPGKVDKSLQQGENGPCRNLRFYRNQLRSKPDNALVSEFHSNWRGAYQELESHHGFIQWLFPIREKGMNYQSQPLTLYEKEKLRNDDQARLLLLRSLELMMDFYGFDTIMADRDSPDSDVVFERSEKWRVRFRNLNTSSHNYLRITRIIKCLGELGHERLQAVVVRAFLQQYKKGRLNNIGNSLENYWIGVVRNGDERQALLDELSEFHAKQVNQKKRSRKQLFWPSGSDSDSEEESFRVRPSDDDSEPGRPLKRRSSAQQLYP
ncbi:MAG: hypothetical protein MHM6MM_001794 [Cercozoa sp. M6MM]